jgi:hypothetical protein
VATGSNCLVRHEYPIEWQKATIAAASKALLTSCLICVPFVGAIRGCHQIWAVQDARNTIDELAAMAGVGLAGLEVLCRQSRRRAA